MQTLFICTDPIIHIICLEHHILYEEHFLYLDYAQCKLRSHSCLFDYWSVPEICWFHKAEIQIPSISHEPTPNPFHSLTTSERSDLCLHSFQPKDLSINIFLWYLFWLIKHIKLSLFWVFVQRRNSVNHVISIQMHPTRDVLSSAAGAVIGNPLDPPGPNCYQYTQLNCNPNTKHLTALTIPTYNQQNI